MLKLIQRRSRKIGLPPGTPVYVGEKKVEEVSMTVLDYDQEHVEERELKSVEEAFPFKDTHTVAWLNINGLHEVELLQELGARYNVHPLVLEDIVNTGQRTKIETFEEHLFIVLKMITYNDKKAALDIEQVSLILGKHFVITFQERKGDIFDPIRERIRKNRGRIRKAGPDYLTYALIDILVDHYFLVLERLGESIESMEETVFGDPSPAVVEEIHQMKRELLGLRRSIWPLREVLSTLVREEPSLFKKTTGPYLQDVYDHTIQVVDTVETYRDMVSGLLDVYLSSVSNKMNEVMKVLTIIATIFIPLTFIAGIYGMNFEFMPELKLRWAYPAVWVVMLLVLGGMVVYFRRRKWL